MLSVINLKSKINFMYKLILLIVFVAGFSYTSLAQQPTINPDDPQNGTPKSVILQIDKKVWNKVKRSLDGVDSRFYKLRYGNGNVLIDSLGSAEINRLEPISVIGARTSSISTTNIIQVISARGGGKSVEYIVLYWAPDAMSEIPDKVAEVNALLKNN